MVLGKQIGISEKKMLKAIPEMTKRFLHKKLVKIEDSDPAFAAELASLRKKGDLPKEYL